MDLASFPSPSDGVWNLGPVPVRAYALFIIAGIFLAIWLGERRWVTRGGHPGDVTEDATWMVPFGIVGGRIYHVVTSPQAYFGDGGEPVKALYIWEGGLGIWGAIAFGGVGAWIGCRRRGIPLPAFGDALAPGIVLAQALGRMGNYFNQELYGRVTDLPWAVEIDREHRPDATLELATYHPTFLYELFWDVGVAVLVIWADRRFRLGHGRAFALYVAAYTVGRGWIEVLRVDPANDVLVLRLNEWTSLFVFLGAVTYIVLSTRLRPGRETPEELEAARTDRTPRDQDDPGDPRDRRDPGDPSPDQPDTEVPA